jgi:ribosome-associated protein
MDIRKLQRAIVDGLEDVKAQDILVFNTEHLSPLFERVIIASGTSNRQTKALASSVRDAVRSHGMPVLGVEGGDNGEWIIVDCGAAVAHIMQPAIREYYRLEEIWGGKPVKLKLGDGAAKGLPKASEGFDDDDEDLPPPKKAAPAKKATAAKKAAPAKKAATAAKKAPVAKKAPAKASTGRAPTKTAARTTAAKTPARKAAAKTAGKAPAKAPARTAAKKAPAKTSARKTPARR